MKKILFIALLIVIGKSTTNAQIKVVGEEYSTTLSAAKSYYEQDVEFEKIFPKAYLGSGYNVIDMGINCTEPYNSIKMTIPINLNCLGDTLWNYSNLVCPQYGLGDRMNSWGFGIVTDGEKKDVIWEIPAGYYTISGYIIGKENLIELLSMHFSDEDTTRILHSYDNGRTVFRNKYYGIGTTPSIKLLKKQLLTQDFKYLPDGYIAYVKLSSVDTINNKRIDYYAPRLSNLFNIKFYNEIRKQFLNQEIILVRGEQIEFDCKEGEAYHVKQDIIDQGTIMSDAITNEKIKLADRVFTVEDVVVKLKKERDPYLYVIVRGESTGSFAIQPKSIEYEYYVTEFDTIRDGRRHPNYTNYGYPNLKLEAGYMNKINTIKKNDYFKIWQHVTDSVAIIQKETKQKKLNEEKQRLSYKREQELKDKQRKEKFQNSMIAKYGMENGQLIGNRRIKIGMTQEMCRDAWGKPINTYRTTTKYGQREVWCYNYKTRVYFFDGKIVQIDN